MCARPPRPRDPKAIRGVGPKSDPLACSPESLPRQPHSTRTITSEQGGRQSPKMKESTRIGTNLRAHGPPFERRVTLRLRPGEPRFSARSGSFRPIGDNGVDCFFSSIARRGADGLRAPGGQPTSRVSRGRRPRSRPARFRPPPFSRSRGVSRGSPRAARRRDRRSVQS